MATPRLDDGFIDITDQVVLQSQRKLKRVEDGFVDITDQFGPPKPEETGILDAAGKGIASGVTQLAGSTNTALQYVGNRVGSNTLAEAGRTGAEYWEDVGKPYEAPTDLQGDIIDNPALMKNPSWWAYNVAQTGVSMVPGMVVGAGVGGAAVKGVEALGKVYKWSAPLVSNLQKLSYLVPAGVVGGAQEGTSTYNEVLKKGGSEQDAARAMEAMTTASGVLNALSFGKMFKVLNPKEKAGMMNYVRHVLEGGATESITEYLEEPAEVLIKMGVIPDKITKEEIVQQLRSGLNVMPAAFVTGGMGSVAGARYQNKQLVERDRTTALNQPSAAQENIPRPAPSDVPDFQPADKSPDEQLKNFQSDVLSGKVTIQQAFEQKKNILSVAPQFEDDINKVIIEAEGNKLFAAPAVASAVNPEIESLKASIAYRAHVLDENIQYKDTEDYKKIEASYQEDVARLAELTIPDEEVPDGTLQTKAAIGAQEETPALPVADTSLVAVPEVQGETVFEQGVGKINKHTGYAITPEGLEIQRKQDLADNDKLTEKLIAETPEATPDQIKNLKASAETYKAETNALYDAKIAGLSTQNKGSKTTTATTGATVTDTEKSFIQKLEDGQDSLPEEEFDRLDNEFTDELHKRDKDLDWRFTGEKGSKKVEIFNSHDWKQSAISKPNSHVNVNASELGGFQYEEGNEFTLIDNSDRHIPVKVVSAKDGKIIEAVDISYGKTGRVIIRDNRALSTNEVLEEKDWVAPKKIEGKTEPPPSLPKPPEDSTSGKVEAAGEVKEPWQMKAVEVSSEKAKDFFPLEGNVEIENGKPIYKYRTTVKWGNGEKTFEVKTKGPLNGTRQAERLHKEIVKQALAEGKPVPAEVLKDYPNLQPAPKAEDKVEAAGATEHYRSEAKRNIRLNIKKIKERPKDKRTGAAVDSYYDSIRNHVNDLRKEGGVDEDTISVLKKSGLYDDKYIKEMVPEYQPVTEPAATEQTEGTAMQDKGAIPEQKQGVSPVIEVPVDQIKISEDVPQFKGDANEIGVVQELQGTEYRRVPMNAIIVWERLNGDLEVITGRHRLDLARRIGEKTIPAQIVKESEGFDKQKALTFDAEQNILDNQGTEKDYANYFRNTEISEEEAKLRGLLRGAKASSAWILGRYATDQTFNAYFRTGEISFKQAVAVSKAAPNDERLQLAGRSFVLKNPRATESEVENFVHALSLVKDIPQQKQGDLFGFDDSAIRTAEMQAKKAASIIARLKKDSSHINAAIRGEGKLELSKEGAKEYGIEDSKDKEQLKNARNKILSQISEWEKWYVNPELVQQLTETKTGQPETDVKTEKTEVGEQAVIPGASYSETFSLTNPETEISKPLSEQKQTNNEDIPFQRRNQDARYLELAKDPEKNKAELQKMVDEAAKKAGYNVEGLGAVYHGTPNVKHNDKWVVAISQIHDIILPDEPPLRHDVSPFDENTEHYDRFWQFQRFLSANYYRNLQNKIPENLRYTYELGQSVPFTTFDETLRGSTTEAADAKRGFFFTKDEPFAHRFRTSYEYDPFTRVTKVVKGPGPIYKVYLKTGNVLDLTKMSAEQSKMGQQYGDLDDYDTVINKVKWRPSMNRAASKVTQEIMVKSASQIKSADPVTYDDNGNVIPLSERFNPENPDIRYQRGNSTGLYSQLEKVVTEKLIEMPSKVQSIPKWLERQNVKPAEMKWMGVEQWLTDNQKDGRIDKQAFASFIRANQIEIQEVTKGGNIEGDVEAWWNDEGGANEEVPYSELAPEERADATRRYNDEVGDYAEDNTKFSSYQLPGDENYREVLLTLPSTSKAPTLEQYRNYYIRQNPIITESEKAELNKWYESDSKSGKYEAGLLESIGADIHGYKSAHWDEPNVLMHVRMNDRTDTEGNRVLFLEEVQSDWHQEGKKKGYTDANITKEVAAKEKKITELEAEGMRIADKYRDIRNERYKDRTMEFYSWLTGHDKSYAEVQKQWVSLKNEVGPLKKQNQGVPPAPFADTWHEYAMKRMLRYAAENGYDKLAWTTGDQQAERYDLSKQISEVTYERGALNAYDLNGKGVIREQDVPPEKLEDYIGKEPARKLLGQEGQRKVISGLDLKVGGEGMKSFYDNLIPGFMNRYVKQWGAKVGTSKIPTETTTNPWSVYKNGELWDGFRTEKQAKEYVMNLPDDERYIATIEYEADMPEYSSVSSVPITPAMRESVMQGQPMFRRNQSPAGLQQSAVQSIIDKAVTAIPNAPKVNVVQGNENCPDEVQKIMEREGIDDAMGFTYKGEVYLVSDNLQNTEEVLRTFAHELTHSGLGKFFQRQRMSRALVPVRAQYEALMDAIYRAHHKEIEQLTKTTHTHLNTRTAKDRRQACEEWLCNQSYEAQSKWYDKLVAIFHDLLRAIGLDVKLSDAEVRVVLQDAFKEFGSEGVSFMTAWHGSPHDFDKFSKDKIGTGEGAQAYGHGLYFSGKREVAEYYKNSTGEWTLDGESAREWVLKQPHNNMEQARRDGTTITEATEKFIANRPMLDAVDAIISYGQNAEYMLSGNQKAISILRALQSSERLIKPGRLYQVELAPAEDEYLLWDKPLSEQSEKVKAAIKSHRITKALPLKGNTGRGLYHHTAAWIGQNDANGGADGEKKASELLHSLGVRGIKYLDGSSRPTDVISKQMQSVYDKFNGDIEKAVDYLMQYVHDTPKEKEKIRKNYTERFNQGYNFNYVIFSDEDIEVTAKFQRRSPVRRSQPIFSKPANATKQWWVGMDIQKQLESLPRESWQRVRNFLREGYVPITRAEADELYYKGFDYTVALVEMRGPVDSVGNEGVFMKPLNHWSYGGRRYDGTYQYFKDAIAKYHEAAKRFQEAIPQTTRENTAPESEESEVWKLKDAEPAAMPTLPEVQEVFKGQTVTEVDGGFAIKTRGGQDLIIRSVDHISPNRMALKIGYGQNALKNGKVIAGKYSSGNIELTKGVADKWTLAHESTHFMEDIGVLGSLDVAALRGHIKRLVRDGKFKTKNKDDIGGAEDRANFLADALTKEPTGFLGRIVNKIQDFIDKLVNAFGIRTVRGIARDIRTGKVYDRQGGAGRGLDEYYKVAAWHGSPHDFDKFSKDKIGTGEGAQAYGHGLYFAGKREVAEFYKKRLSSNNDDSPGSAAEWVKYYGSKENALKSAKGQYDNELRFFAGREKEIADVHKTYKKLISELETYSPGRLYQVELAPDEDEYLLWDKPLSEQSEKVKAALKPARTDQFDLNPEDGTDIENGGTAYARISGAFGDSDKAASDYLHSLGIRGIKYLDGSSRPTDIVSKQMKSAYDKFNGDIEKAVDHLMKYVHETPKEKEKIRKNYIETFNKGYNYNYVIFSDEDVDIIEKYSIRKQQDPPTSKDPKVLNLYLKDETDAIVQTIMNKLQPPHMTWLETILKSPEWFNHPQISKIVKLFMRDRNEIYHETFNDLNMADDIDAPESTVTEAAKALKNKGLSLADRMSGKVSKEYQRLQEIIDEGDTSWKRDTSKPLADQLKKFEEHIRKNSTEDTIRVWKLYRQSYDKALDLQTKQMRQMIAEIIEEANFRGETPDLTEMRQTLKGALAQMEEWRGFYAPRMREMGNWKVQAYKEHGPMRENREWYREHRGSELSAQRLANKLKREGWKIHDVGEVERLPETIYQDVNSVATAKLIDTALEKVAKKSQLTNDQTVKFNEEILREVSNAIKARGFRSTMIHRGESVVRGFIEDPIQRHLQYINNLSGGIAKAKVARMAYQEMTGQKFQGKQYGGIDPVKEPQEYRVAQNYIEEQLRNVEPIDRMIGIAKSVATFKFLGFNLRSIAVNTTAVVTTAPAAIHQYAMGGHGSMFRVLKELGRAGADYGALMAGRQLKDAGEQSFMDEQHRKGWDDAQYTREALGEISKTHSRVWSSMMDGSMYLFGISEKWNRGTTMLAAYRLARRNGLGHAEAAEAAKTSSDKAHGVYGKSTMPMWAQGTNPAAKLGQMMYVYQKFGHNYLQMLYDMGFKRRNIKGAMFAFLSPLVLAGGAAFPFKDLIFGFAGVILRSLFGEDRDPEKWVWDVIRKHMGSDAEKYGRHGLTGALGVDISGSLSAGVGIPKDFIDLTGAIGGVATEIKEAAENIGRGKYVKAAEHLLPTGFANPVRAFRESGEGVSTRNNRRVWNEKGKPYVPSAGATTARVFGFRSTDQAVLSERMWEGHREQANFNEKKSAIYEKYRAWLLGSRDPQEHKKITKEVRAFNESVKNVKGVPRITFEALRRQETGLKKPAKRERAILSPVS